MKVEMIKKRRDIFGGLIWVSLILCFGVLLPITLNSDFHMGIILGIGFFSAVILLGFWIRESRKIKIMNFIIDNF